MEVVVGRDAVHLGISPCLSLWWSPADIKGKKQEENGMKMLHKKVRVDVVSYMLSVSDERGYWHSESREGNYSECISPRCGEVWCKPWKYGATTSCIT